MEQALRGTSIDVNYQQSAMINKHFFGSAGQCTVTCEASAKLCLDKNMFVDFFALFDLRNACRCWQQIQCVPEHSCKELQGLPLWDSCCPLDAIRAFTGGSFFEDSGKSGWAVLFLVFAGDCWCNAGFAAGCIQGSACERGLQSIGFHAYSAEVVALMAALAHLGHYVGTQAVVYDATSAADVVLGGAWPQSPSLVAKMLAQYVRCRATDLSWRHVKSHTGCPFNDFVDAVAKDAAANGTMSGGDVSPLGEALVDPYFIWMWWHEFADQHPGVLPDFDSKGATVPPSSVQRATPSTLENGRIPGAPEELQCREIISPGRFNLLAVTYNTLSLYSAAQRVLLCRQFADACVHLVGLQETRKVCQPAETLGSFKVFASEHEAGREGCQIRLNMTAPTGADAEGSPCFWDPSAHIWKSSSRTLAVFASTGGCQMAIISAHMLPPQHPEKWRLITGGVS